MDHAPAPLAELYALIDGYVASLSDGSSVVEYLPPDQLVEALEPAIGEDPSDASALMEAIRRYIRYSVRTGHPQFFNQLYAGFNWPAFVGDVVTSLTNTSMYTYEVAPAATVLELKLIEKMNTFTGWANGDGVLLSGGSNANLVAMFSARNRTMPRAKRHGLYGTPPMTAFVSNQAHYSFGTAANLMGLGTDFLFKVPTDENGRMRPEELERLIVSSLERGELPFFVGATAGTTVLGAFDPIEPLADVCERHGLWLHVDGSFGGSAILSRTHRHLVQGIERADSYTWNPHKLMNVPLVCSAILVRELGVLQKNLVALDTDYIFHESESQHFDLGKKSLQCGRRVDSLKLWLAWKAHGDAGYRGRIDHLFDMASHLEARVKEEPRLELLAPVQSFCVCFRYRAGEGAEANRFNRELRDRLRMSGQSLVNYGFLGDRLVIRWVAANADITRADVDRFLDLFCAEGDALRAEQGVS